MKTKKTKLIICLIIIAFVFQFTPTTLIVDGPQSHAPNITISEISDSPLHDALLINRFNYNNHINNFVIKNLPYSLVQSYQVHLEPIIRYSPNENSFDYRKVIRQTIPQYFNGGKYKRLTFSI